MTRQQQQGLKRRREAIGAGAAVSVGVDSGDAPKGPSREARAAWNDDFPAKFHVLDKIGEGSFGTVWLGRRRNTEGGEKQQQQQQQQHSAVRQKKDDLVAIKRINPTCSPSRILNEFEQMRKLRGGNHNVIQVQGVVRTPGGVFALVMPYFEHDDFRQVIKTLTLSGVAAYTRSLLTALAHIHAHGVIHRDIKPRNFMYNAKTREGVLIDFGLAEPAEKWQERSEALARYRDKRTEREARGGKKNQSISQQRAKVPTPAAHIATGTQGKPRPPSGANASTNGRKGLRPTAVSGSAVAGGRVNASHENTTAASTGAGGGEKEGHLKLLRKAERGGTTGFRAPEILWHGRDQTPAVDVWSAGVILLCLLSRRYPVFPCADNDEMALVQIAMLLGGADGIIRAARESGRCHIAEFPSVRQPGQATGGGGGGGGGGASRLEELCAPLLGGWGGGGGVGVEARARGACDEDEESARADALKLLRGMLKVDPRERLTAKDALFCPFVVDA